MKEQQQLKTKQPNKKTNLTPNSSMFTLLEAIISFGTKDKHNMGLKGKYFFFPLRKQAELEVLLQNSHIFVFRLVWFFWCFVVIVLLGFLIFFF